MILNHSSFKYEAQFICMLTKTPYYQEINQQAECMLAPVM